jgi:hypothetical protein
MCASVCILQPVINLIRWETKMFIIIHEKNLWKLEENQKCRLSRNLITLIPPPYIFLCMCKCFCYIYSCISFSCVCDWGWLQNTLEYWQDSQSIFNDVKWSKNQQGLISRQTCTCFMFKFKLSLLPQYIALCSGIIYFMIFLVCVLFFF